jgi:hypothetical protein
MLDHDHVIHFRPQALGPRGPKGKWCVDLEDYYLLKDMFPLPANSVSALTACKMKICPATLSAVKSFARILYLSTDLDPAPPSWLPIDDEWAGSVEFEESITRYVL